MPGYGRGNAQAFASDALGSDLKGRTVELAPGVSVTDNSLWSATYSDLRTEYYVTYEPGAAASPLIWYGSTISSKSQLASAAAQLEEQGYRVLAGINGGFFNTERSCCWSSDHRRCDPISGPVELSYGGHPRRRNRLP